MRLGYPCLNWTLECKGNKTLRLKSYSEERLIETINNNLECLSKILQFNVENGIFFFRITSDLVPLASHPICKFDWQRHFRDTFNKMGRFIEKHGMRISMHPDQFTLINSIDEDIFERSHRELLYHAQLLDLMRLDNTAKIQVHVGGVYGDRNSSIKRFIRRYYRLDTIIKKRLVIENDDVNYNLSECLYINGQTGIPVLFDVFHHSINCSGESLRDAVRLTKETWKKKDGNLMVDYSFQRRDAKPGSHAESINIKIFKKFLAETKPYDFDIMLEIKDKEKSALKAVRVLRGDSRYMK